MIFYYWNFGGFRRLRCKYQAARKMLRCGRFKVVFLDPRDYRNFKKLLTYAQAGSYKSGFSAPMTRFASA
jgi:hypothetical protein